MSDKIVTARHDQVCDICHHTIHAGERCRLVRDDFWPQMVWFEHLRCPRGAVVVTTEPRLPLQPQPKLAFAN